MMQYISRIVSCVAQYIKKMTTDNADSQTTIAEATTNALNQFPTPNIEELKAEVSIKEDISVELDVQQESAAAECDEEIPSKIQKVEVHEVSVPITPPKMEATKKIGESEAIEQEEKEEKNVKENNEVGETPRRRSGRLSKTTSKLDLSENVMESPRKTATGTPSKKGRANKSTSLSSAEEDQPKEQTEDEQSMPEEEKLEKVDKVEMAEKQEAVEEIVDATVEDVKCVLPIEEASIAPHTETSDKVELTASKRDEIVEA